MASDIKVQIAGLVTNPNPFSSSPPGSCAFAEDVVLDATNAMEPRRGFAALSASFGSASDRAKVLTFFGNGESGYTLIAHYTGDKLARYSGGSWTDYSGTYAASALVTGAKLQFVRAARNLYFNCSDGTRVLSTAAGTPSQAGVPKGLRVSATHVSANGWQTYDSAVAYRAVFGLIDANSNEKLGVPTGRYIHRNLIHVPIAGIVRTALDGSHPAGKVTVTCIAPHGLGVGNAATLSPGEANFAAGSKTVVLVPSELVFTYNEAGANVASTLAQDFQATRSTQVRVDIPSGITTSHFLQLFRSEMTSDADLEPSDELYQTMEYQPDATDISNGYALLSDITPEALLGDAAPWDANGGYGLLQANERPPLGLAMTYWDNRLWWGNTTQRHRLFIELLGVGSPSGAQNNDTLTIAGTAITFKTSPTTADHVQLYTADTPSLNVERTAHSLVKAINASVASVRAYYVTAANDTARGKVLLEETAIGGALFAVSASRVASWGPYLPRNSDNNRRMHGLLFSKAEEPEAVPVVNEVFVGSASDRILHVAALKSSIIVFKESEGIWSVTGSNGRYAAERIGAGKLLARESVAAFAEKLWAWTDQGFTTITEGAGVSVVSFNIEDTLVALAGTAASAVSQYAFGLGYESARRYLVWAPQTSANTFAKQAFNYSTSTRAFTRWTTDATCGVMHPTEDKIYLGSSTTNSVLVERKDFANSDYSDPDVSATLSGATTATTLTLASSTNVLAGDRFSATDTGSGITITGLFTAKNGNVMTFINESLFTLPTTAAGPVTVYKAIFADVRWHPVTLGNPAIEKMHRQLTLMFDDITTRKATLSFATELGEPSGNSVAIDFSEAPAVQSTRVLHRVAPLPRNVATCAQLSVEFSTQEAQRKWKLHGFVVDLDPNSEKAGR